MDHSGYYFHWTCNYFEKSLILKSIWGVILNAWRESKYFPLFNVSQFITYLSELNFTNSCHCPNQRVDLLQVQNEQHLACVGTLMHVIVSLKAMKNLKIQLLFFEDTEYNSELPEWNTNFYFFIYLNVSGNEIHSHLKGQSEYGSRLFISPYHLDFFFFNYS